MSFFLFHLPELALHMEQRFQHTIKKICANSTSSSNLNNFCATNLLQNISYCYCCNYAELMAVIHNLRNIFKDEDKYKLIIIDSFSFCMRKLDDITLRTRILYEILNDLKSLAMEYNIAVSSSKKNSVEMYLNLFLNQIIITNELTTRCVDNKWFITPALGDSHTHKINQRLILSQDEDKDYHIVMIDKSVMCSKIAIRFKVY